MSRQVIRVVEEHVHHVVSSGGQGPAGAGGGGSLEGLDAEHLMLFIYGGSAARTGGEIDGGSATDAPVYELDCEDSYK